MGQNTLKFIFPIAGLAMLIISINGFGLLGKESRLAWVILPLGITIFVLTTSLFFRGRRKRETRELWASIEETG